MSGQQKQAPQVEISVSEGLGPWLARQNASLAFTTGAGNKLFLVGRQEDGKVSLFERTFPGCGALWAGAGTLLVSTHFQLWQLENVLQPGQTQQGFDRVFLPQVARTTGSLGMSDIAVDGRGLVAFANPLFSCLAAPSDRYSFAPLWTPPFISALMPEDRCHLSGLAVQDGALRYATAWAESDAKAGWRAAVADGGLLLEVPGGRQLCTGLSLPQSPRLAGSDLWLLNAGRGELGRVDRDGERFEPVAALPGFPRGLALAGGHAVIGLSRLDSGLVPDGTPLAKRLAADGSAGQCGLEVVDLASGQTVAGLRLSGAIGEVRDVAILPEVVRPMAVGLQHEEIARIFTLGPAPGARRSEADPVPKTNSILI